MQLNMNTNGVDMDRGRVKSVKTHRRNDVITLYYPRSEKIHAPINKYNN